MTNYQAVLGMFSIVIVLYALHESHTHYLPDLFGLALALTSDRRELAIGAIAVLALIRHTRLGDGLHPYVAEWLYPIVIPRASNMSISPAELEQLESAYKERIYPPTAKTERIEIPQPVAEKSPENVISEKAEIMARSVLAGTIGKTEATRLLAGARGGAKYQRASRVLNAELDRQRNHYPPDSNLKRFE